MAELGFSFTAENGCIRANLKRHDMKHLREKTGKFLLSTAVMTYEEAAKHHKALGVLLRDRPAPKSTPALDEVAQEEDDHSDVL